jgi:hypothetical protein
MIGEHMSTSICSINDMLHLIHPKKNEAVITNNKDIQAPLLSLFSFHLYPEEKETNEGIGNLESDMLKPGGKMVILSGTRKRKIICDSKLISVLNKILKNKNMYKSFLKNQLFSKTKELCFISQLCLRLLINVEDGDLLSGDCWPCGGWGGGSDGSGQEEGGVIVVNIIKIKLQVYITSKALDLICMYIQMNIYVYVFMYIYIYACIYLYIFKFICIDNPVPLFSGGHARHTRRGSYNGYLNMYA